MDYKKARILIVDDQRAFHVTLKGMLINLGIKNFQFAESGETAIRLCRAQAFDLLLVDYNLGHGKNGRQVLDELKAKRLLPPDCSFFIITGDNTRPMVLGALEHQPDDYLMKPFSIGQLDKRIRRAKEKREALKPVYQAIYDDNPEEVIQLCQQLLASGTRYSQYCRQLLAGYYRKTAQHDKAEALLTAELAQRSLAWAKVELAHNLNETGRQEQVSELLEPLIKQQPMLVDAYDCLAESQYLQGQAASALATLERARDISPIATDRQLKFARIAREAGRYDLAQEAYKQVYDINKGSFHESPTDLCNYIRASVEAAMKTDDDSKARRLENNALALLYRTPQTPAYNDFDVDGFGELIKAYKSAEKGELIKAKKLYYKATRSNANPDEAVKVSEHYLPEGIFITSKVGEYEEAELLIEQAKTSALYSDNPFLTSIIEQQTNAEEDDLHGRIEQFNLHNASGKQAYEEGNNAVAVYEFEEALKCAPTNTGAALNLIQALLKLLGEKKKIDSKQVAKCKHAFRIVDGMLLPESQMQRRKELWQQFSHYRFK